MSLTVNFQPNTELRSVSPGHQGNVLIALFTPFSPIGRACCRRGVFFRIRSLSNYSPKLRGRRKEPTSPFALYSFARKKSAAPEAVMLLVNTEKSVEFVVVLNEDQLSRSEELSTR